MTRWTRRKFVGLTGATLLAAADPKAALAQALPRVVVVGGGIGGATVARYLAALAPPIHVTLVEPKERYVTCFFSNLFLAGLRTLDSLSHGYRSLAEKSGVMIVHEAATGIDPVARTVELKSGSRLPYDRLVLAPGVSFRLDAIEGYDEAATEVMPHAWNAGPQSVLLRRQLESMEDGGVFLIVVPPDPFRCPPGPYERASLVADYFKRHKPRSKILILDAKDAFKPQDVFQEAWSRHYPGMIEWLPAQFTGATKAVDVGTRSVITEGETFKAAVANVIPPQRAGALAIETGLADKSGWCPVDPMTFESTLQRNIHLVGDAIIGGDMPKSAFSANSQAKACAFAIAAELAGSRQFAPHLFNSCYTFLARDDAFTNALNFRPDPVTGKIKVVDSFVSKVGESAELRRKTARHAIGWYAAFTRDTFG
ncbi:NAD(P)/FAD-dependent oxidoreductase [Mesorhizobium sp. L-8-3]|uniref:NAD(P)/FAD-dependent oxidoreductase n=1 Tax=Mesorhizobium sp. L-8-3 TaxID=2744522 RepID=UPI001927D9B4|nr:NAD(P)/FAD-dependent oxidoreductase [Mesorhizobium sp. L-8-3]BCH22793.1 cytochrome c [Mesorhizobium sp. L-8-3]